jgi:thioredoxin-related protein
MRNSQFFMGLRTIIALAFFGGALGGDALAQSAASIDESKLENSSRDWERILPVAVDLKRDGAKASAEQKPILLFFNLQSCHFCRYSLRTAVVPMFRDPAWRSAIEFRQITIDDDKSLIDFDGKKISNIEFAKARKGSFTPTVMLVDGDGKLLGESIVGIANADYHAGYVEALARSAVESLKAKK